MVAALAMPAWLSSTTHAQGTSGQLPDPISAVELSKLMRDFVRPTNEQATAIEALHDSYKERFRALREGDIEKFLMKMQQLQGGSVPGKAQVDEFVRGYERVFKQIEDLDDSFFAAVATLLGDERAQATARAKDARARRRLQSGMANGMVPGTPVADASALAIELRLGDAEAAAIEATLVSYERRLTASMKDLQAAALRAAREMFDEFERAGLAGLTQEAMAEDPERMQQIMETMQRASATVALRYSAKLREVNDMSAKTVQSLQAQLSPKSARRLRLAYLAQVYPELPSDPAGTERLFLWALRSTKTDEASKPQIAAAYERWQQVDGALVEQGVKLIDELRAVASPFEMGDMYVRQGEALQKLALKRAEAASAAIESVAELIGKERAERVVALLTAKQGDVFDETFDPEASEEAGAPGISVSAAPSEANRFSDGSTGSMPGSMPVPASAIDTIAAFSALDESQRLLADTIRSDYAKQWEAEFVPLLAKATASATSRWSLDQATQQYMLDAGKQAAFFAEQQAARDKAAALDAGLFQALAAVLGESALPAVSLVRMERAIDSCAPAQDGMAEMGYMGGTAGVTVNFVSVLRSAGVTPAEAALVHAALAPGADALLAACAAAQASAVQSMREQDEFSVQNMRMHAGQGQADPAEMRRLSDSWRALYQRRQAADAARTAALSRAWDTALATLEEPRRETLRLAYEEASYPAIFRDSRSAQPFIDKARGLHDLTDEQRVALLTLADKYRAEHVAVCRRMKPPPEDPTRALPDASSPEDSRRYWQERMEQANIREKARFERDENSQRAVSQLRRVLTPAQAERIAGLSKYEDNDGTGAQGELHVEAAE